MGDSNEGLGLGGGGGGMASLPGMAAAKRRAIRQTMRPPRIKHGLVHEPTIKHPRDNQGPSFGLGGGYKAGGF